ncbi:MAG: methyl-accepting chemotaxis protein [Rhodopila sp.]
MEIIRRTTLRFYSDSNREALTQARAASAEAHQLLKRAQERAQTAEARATGEEISRQLEAYNAEAQSMFVMADVVTEQRSKLVAAGNELASATAKVVGQTGQDLSVGFTAAEVTKTVLEMRLPAWKFIALVDPEFVTAFKGAYAAALAAVDRLDQMADAETHDLIKPLKAAMADDVATFDLLSTTMLANKQLYYVQMVPAITKLQARLTDWTATLARRFEAARTDSITTISSAAMLQLIVAGIVVLIGAAAAFVIGRGIGTPLSGMTATMLRLADGDTSVAVPSLNAADEIGEMAKAVEVFKANMIRTVELVAESEKERTRKEARQRAIEGFISGFDQSIRDMLHMLASAATEMQAAAQSMTQTATHTNEQATTMAAAAEQASANVQTMAAATEEMAASATEISHQVARSAQITSRAVESARRTDQQVQSLSDAAQRIEDVVAIINGIAGQTNLLALNATIEAARAGDAGKGFAVVASEVKALAGQTGKATEEIGAQIQAIQSATREAVEAIRAINTTINEVNDISTAIAAAMEEQGATTSQMAHNTQEAAKGTQDVSATISNVSQGANATGAAASQVLSAAGELGRQAETLRAEVDGFLDKIRAA